MQILALFYIFLGGGLGALSRAFLSFLFTQYFNNYSKYFYIPTLIINLVACFALGYFTQKFFSQDSSQKLFYYLLCVGFCGGLSTFSTFSIENFYLLKAGRELECLVYILTICYSWSSYGLSRL